MAGAIDLFAGSKPLTGTNLWEVDKNPLNVLDGGIQDVIGQQAGSAGSQTNNFIQSVINAILGINPATPQGQAEELLWEGNWGYLTNFFGDILSWLGLSSYPNTGTTSPGTSGWDTVTAIINWIDSLLFPTNKVAGLSSDPNSSLGLTGFVPLENLALDAIGSAIGDVQGLIDAILSIVGFPPGSGTTAEVNTFFTDIYDWLGQPELTSSGYNAATAVENWVTSLLAPTKMVAPMDPVTQLINALHIPGLDASQITSGQFPQDMVLLTNISASLITGVLNALNIPGLDASKIVSGIFATSNIPGLDASWIVSGGFPQWLLPILPVGSVGQAQPNLLSNPNYAGATSVNAPNSPWTWDGAVDHTGDGSGSVKVTASGTTLQLNSDPATPVAAGQVLQASHWLEWSGVSGTGVCFELNLVLYLKGNVVGTQNVASVTNPAASSGWVQLSGNYTVLSGVDGVRLQIEVTSGATAGTIHWDDASLTKIGAFDASWITSGQFQQWVLPLLPVSSVGQVTPNLLSNPNFAGSQSVVAGTAWTYDGTVTHTADGSGSVKTTANGSLLSLYSDPSTPASQSQILAASVYAQWSGVTGTGPCIQLSLVSYLNGQVVATTVLQTISNPAANASWTFLQGVYTVPAGVDAVRLEYQVLPGATAGTVWFDDASLVKTNNLLEAWTTGLPGDLNNLFTQTSAAASNINGIQTNGLGNITDLQSLSNYITNALVGLVGVFTGTTLAQANSSMQSIYSNMLNNTQLIQSLQSQNAAAVVSGTSITIDFANYPDGPLSAAGFTVTYVGPGSSTVGIKGGLAGWTSIVNDGSVRQAFVISNTPTTTNFQRVAGSMNSAPSGATSAGQPYFYALGRVDNPNNPLNYVWARAYCTGFLTYKCDLGCTVAGVPTVWLTGVPLTWSTSMSVLFGANGNPRRYQVFSGTTLVVDYTEVGTASQLAYMYWGAINTVTYDAYYNSPGTGGTLAGTAVADNAPPSRVGSTFNASRLNTANYTGASGNQMAPANFFDTTNWTTPDLVPNSDGSVTVTKEGSYVVKVQYNTISSYYNQWFGPLLYVKPSGGSYALAKRGLCMYLTGELTALSIVGDLFNVYCKPGDTLMPGWYASTAGAVVTGTADGLASMWTISLANWSTA